MSSVVRDIQRNLLKHSIFLIKTARDLLGRNIQLLQFKSCSHWVGSSIHIWVTPVDVIFVYLDIQRHFLKAPLFKLTVSIFLKDILNFNLHFGCQGFYVNLLIWIIQVLFCFKIHILEMFIDLLVNLITSFVFRYLVNCLLWLVFFELTIRKIVSVTYVILLFIL